MSQLNILCAIAFCFSTLMAVRPATNPRVNELTDLGYLKHTYEVCMDAYQIVETDIYNGEYNGYTSDIPVRFQSVLAKPDKSVPAGESKVYPAGSPVLWVKNSGKYVDGQDQALRAGFGPHGECGIAKGSSFIELLSDVFYFPQTNKIVLKAYSSEPSPLAEELFDGLKKSSCSLLTWQLFGSSSMQLLYSGTPWECLYASTKNAKSETELKMINYLAPSGMSADEVLKGAASADIARISIGSDGIVTASLNGYADREAPNQYLTDGIYRNLSISIAKTENGSYIRNKATTHILMSLFPQLKKVKDYVGITAAPIRGALLLEDEKKDIILSNQQAYERVSSALQSHVSYLPFGQVSDITEVLDKVSS